MRLRNLQSLLLPSLAFVALSLPACVDASATGPVLEQQRRTIEQLDRSAAEDRAALRELASALLSAQRERLVASIEIDLVARVLDERAEPPADAPGWIVDYSNLLRANADADARRDALVHAPDVKAFDDAVDTLLAALDGRSTLIASMFADLLADNLALADAAGARIDVADASREAASELWRVAILDHIDDPEQRAAASRLLDNLLNPNF